MQYSTAIAAAFAAGATAAFSPGWAPNSEGSGSGWSGEGEGAGWSSGAVVPTQSWVTDVLTAYTTYCPEATVITHGPSTYSVSEATTLTITGPVTVTYPVTVSTTISSSVSSSAATPPPPETTTPVAPLPPVSVTTPASPVVPPPMSTGVPPVYSVPANGTVPVAPAPTGTAPAKTTPAAPVYTGAASALKIGSAGLAAVFGLVAYAL